MLTPTSICNVKIGGLIKSKLFDGVVLKKFGGKYYPDKRYRNFLKVKYRTYIIYML